MRVRKVSADDVNIVSKSVLYGYRKTDNTAFLGALPIQKIFKR